MEQFTRCLVHEDVFITEDRPCIDCKIEGELIEALKRDMEDCFKDKRDVLAMKKRKRRRIAA